jgi:hypothetical protein
MAVARRPAVLGLAVVALALVVAAVADKERSGPAGGLGRVSVRWSPRLRLGVRWYGTIGGESFKVVRLLKSARYGDKIICSVRSYPCLKPLGAGWHVR